jgi:hypothetical protein
MPMRQTGMAATTITLTHYAEDMRRKTSSLIGAPVPDRGLLSPSPANAHKSTPGKSADTLVLAHQLRLVNSPPPTQKS